MKLCINSQVLSFPQGPAEGECFSVRRLAGERAALGMLFASVEPYPF